MNYRNPALISLAAKAPHCMVPGCGVHNDGQVVSAHSNQARDGKGMSIKASDAMIAFACWTCHGRIDQGNESKEIRTALWEAAHRATMRWLIETGHFIVSPIPTPPPVVEVKPSRKIAKGRKLQGAGFAKSETPRPIPARADPWPKRPFSPSPKRRVEGGEG